MSTAEQSALGKATVYGDRSEPDLLSPIARAPKRAELGIDGAVPFHGVDIWNAYELSWLDPRGKPQAAMAELRAPATSPRLVVSKSLKLYLNGFTGERLTLDPLAAHMRRDHDPATGQHVDAAIV